MPRSCCKQSAAFSGSGSVDGPLRATTRPCGVGGFILSIPGKGFPAPLHARAPSLAVPLRWPSHITTVFSTGQPQRVFASASVHRAIGPHLGVKWVSRACGRLWKPAEPSRSCEARQGRWRTSLLRWRARCWLLTCPHGCLRCVQACMTALGHGAADALCSCNAA